MTGGREISLTQREREVRDLVCRGLSNKEMARELGIGARTIEGHRRNVMHKFGVRNAVELIRRVYRIEP